MELGLRQKDRYTTCALENCGTNNQVRWFMSYRRPERYLVWQCLCFELGYHWWCKVILATPRPLTSILVPLVSSRFSWYNHLLILFLPKFDPVVYKKFLIFGYHQIAFKRSYYIVTTLIYPDKIWESRWVLDINNVWILWCQCSKPLVCHPPRVFIS